MFNSYLHHFCYSSQSHFLSHYTTISHILSSHSNVLDFFQKKNLSVVSKISLFQFIVKRDVLSDGESSNSNSSNSSSSCTIDGNEDIYIEALHRIEDLYQRNLLVQYKVNNNTAGDDSNNDKYDDNNDDNDNVDVRYPNNYETDNLSTASSIAISSTSSSTIMIDNNRKQVDEAVFLQSYIPTSLNDISNPQDEMIRLQTGQRELLYASAISSMLGDASSSSHHHAVLSVEESGSVVVRKQSTVDQSNSSKYNNHRDSECDTEDDDEKDDDCDDDSDDDDDNSDDDDEEEDGRYRKVPLPEHEIREMR